MKPPHHVPAWHKEPTMAKDKLRPSDKTAPNVPGPSTAETVVCYSIERQDPREGSDFVVTHARIPRDVFEKCVTMVDEARFMPSVMHQIEVDVRAREMGQR